MVIAYFVWEVPIVSQNMRIDNITLYDWRNYSFAQANFVPGVNLLVGDNAQGKTNLLEAIIYLSQFQSFRTRSQSELIRIGADFSDLRANIICSDRNQNIRAVIFSGRRPRQLYLNDVKKKSSADFSGVLPTVLFCPEDLLVLKSGAQSRRRMIDHALCQLQPVYAAALMEYNRCLDQKSRILKDCTFKPGLLDILPEYNERLAQIGATIVYYRARYIRALNEAAQIYHSEFSGGKEVLHLSYQTVKTIENIYSPKQRLYECLREHQESHNRAERETGQCLSGPHKDDLNAEVNNLSVKSYGSQGQTRTAAISLKLAERELMRKILKEEPVLLLDDVLSELDAGRQDYVLNKLKEGQVFITCCEKNKLTEIGKVFSVQNGCISCM